MIMKEGCRCYSVKNSLSSLPIFIYLPSLILPVSLLFSLPLTPASLLLSFPFLTPFLYSSTHLLFSHLNLVNPMLKVKQKNSSISVCSVLFTSTSHYTPSITFSYKVYSILNSTVPSPFFFLSFYRPCPADCPVLDSDK